MQIAWHMKAHSGEKLTIATNVEMQFPTYII